MIPILILAKTFKNQPTTVATHNSGYTIIEFIFNQKITIKKHKFRALGREQAAYMWVCLCQGFFICPDIQTGDPAVTNLFLQPPYLLGWPADPCSLCSVLLNLRSTEYYAVMILWEVNLQCAAVMSLC